MSCASAARVATIPPLMIACILSCMQAPIIDLESQTEVTGYTIFYGTGDFTSVTRPASVTSYAIPSPVLFSTYQVKMTARNIGGTSGESGTVSKGKCVTIQCELVLSMKTVFGIYVYECRMRCKPNPT